jgi:DNA-binding MarR family transcriptional regulator
MHKLLEKMGVYPGQPPLLFIVGKYDGLSQRELAEKLHIKAATITVMLRRMEKTGLVERKPDRDDQRISRVYLSGRGKEVLSEVRETLKEIEEECFSNLTVEEKLLLRRFMMQMKDNLSSACDRVDKE